MSVHTHAQVERLEHHQSKILTDFAELQRKMSFMLPAAMVKSAEDELRKYIGELQAKRCI